MPEHVLDGSREGETRTSEHVIVARDYYTCELTHTHRLL